MEKSYFFRQERIYYHVKVNLGISFGGKERSLNHFKKSGHLFKMHPFILINSI